MGQTTDLGVERLFTRPKTKAYDQLKWSKRDSLIVNPMSGNPVFEQKGVEFPEGWSLNSINIVAQKYFSGTPGTKERESSLRHLIDRVADTITRTGQQEGYFENDTETENFREELKYLLATQRAAFNSPVWFNIGAANRSQQASACFILAVEDTMPSILNWYQEEGMIFKGGSGAGINLSTIRSSVEPLGKSAGTASGPLSFMRGADASAGAIKSGGKTRRAAKMVILNADHPDIEGFIWCKAIEERKARVLQEAGYKMDLDGEDAYSIQYQNANNSVRVTDEFMQAVEKNGDWQFKAVTTGKPIKTVKARALLHQIAEATWECADPGMQFDTTSNRWHTTPNAGRINGSNPCFTGDSLVHTDKGLIRFDELLNRVGAGEIFGIYTHDATNHEIPVQKMEITNPDAFMITGWNEVLRLRFANGMELNCTPNHRIFTTNRGWVEAVKLKTDDQVKALDLPTPVIKANNELPVSSDPSVYRTKGDHAELLHFPEHWDEDFAHYLGWLIGDGSTSGSTTSTIYGSLEDRQEILPSHAKLLKRINVGRPIKTSIQANGTVQLRLSRRQFKYFLEALGVASVTGRNKSVPWSIYQAPPSITRAFLRGLFDADGCVRLDLAKGSYVGLGSISPELLHGVQLLLTTFGISSHIYKGSEAKVEGEGSLSYVRKNGKTVTYGSSASWDLRISSESIKQFASKIGFSLSRKAALLTRVLAERPRGFYQKDHITTLVGRTKEGKKLTFNLSEPRNHSYVVNGVIVSNCSEYMHLDNSACNLASINLLKYLRDDFSFDIDAFKHTVDIMFTAQEILVGYSEYPTPKITKNARTYRELGLGYANLGALLMAQGLPYDSSEGRAQAAAITALMTGHAYATSAKLARRVGPFAGFDKDREGVLKVLAMHREAVSKINASLVSEELLSAAAASWDNAVELGELYGVRNSQATLLAPTGTIGLMMDCDTTGIEPDLGLVKVKKLVGGGTMSIVNQTVPRALKALGYNPSQVEEIVKYIDTEKTILGAPYLKKEHEPVFACSMGDNAIHYLGHVKMMSAVQPFLSGAISKTVNLPADVTIEDVEQLHIDAWKMGLKSVAIYRDNSKVGQPLSMAKKDAVEVDQPASADTLNDKIIIKGAVRRPLPKVRTAKTFSFTVAGSHGYVTVGEYEDGTPGEVFINIAKMGSTLAGLMDSFARSVSYGLQYGVPLRTYVKGLSHMSFAPAGITDDPDIRTASSLVDYIFRRLALTYLSFDDRLELGLASIDDMSPDDQTSLLDSTVDFGQPIAEINNHNTNISDKAPTSANESLTEQPIAAVQPSTDRNLSVSPDKPKAAVNDSTAPLCYNCGNQTQRAGNCYVCTSCGSTTGCS